MLINSKLFSYSCLKPWHFKPINTVAEGKSPNVGGIARCPRSCVMRLRYRSGWPPAGVFTKHQRCLFLPSMKSGTTPATFPNYEKVLHDFCIIFFFRPMNLYMWAAVVQIIPQTLRVKYSQRKTIYMHTRLYALPWWLELQLKPHNLPWPSLFFLFCESSLSGVDEPGPYSNIRLTAELGVGDAQSGALRLKTSVPLQ